jgi:hypothetical protein
VIDKNPALAKKGSIVAFVRPKRANGPGNGKLYLKGALTIQGTPYQATRRNLQDLSNPGKTGDAEELFINTQWITSTDLRSLSCTVFSILKILLNLIILYVVFARPFVQEKYKLRLIWIGQTIIYYQLMIYSGLSPGVFGGFIDDIQEGMLEASRKYFYVLWG